MIVAHWAIIDWWPQLLGKYEGHTDGIEGVAFCSSFPFVVSLWCALLLQCILPCLIVHHIQCTELLRTADSGFSFSGWHRQGLLHNSQRGSIFERADVTQVWDTGRHEVRHTLTHQVWARQWLVVDWCCGRVPWSRFSGIQLCRGCILPQWMAL